MIERLLEDLLAAERNLDDRLDRILDDLDDQLGPVVVP